MSPRRLLRPCAHPGCPNLVERGHCVQHQPVQQETRRKRDRQYQETRWDTEEQAFYNSAAWRRLRAIYAAQHPFCEPCEKAGRLTATRIVHHRTPIKEGGARLAKSNLEAVCFSHQRRAHPR